MPKGISCQSKKEDNDELRITSLIDVMIKSTQYRSRKYQNPAIFYKESSLKEPGNITKIKKIYQ